MSDLASRSVQAELDIANLFPEKADANPGYHVKDKLENKLHDLVCSGKHQLRATQRKIASDRPTPVSGRLLTGGLLVRVQSGE